MRSVRHELQQVRQTADSQADAVKELLLAAQAERLAQAEREKELRELVSTLTDDLKAERQAREAISTELAGGIEELRTQLEAQQREHAAGLREIAELFIAELAGMRASSDEQCRLLLQEIQGERETRNREIAELQGLLAFSSS